MLSLTDIEDKLLRPNTAQGLFWLMIALLSYELVSGASQYYWIRSDLKKLPLHPVQHAKTMQQSSAQQALKIPVFGEYIPKALVDLDVKPSGLDLSLVGIVFSRDAKHSMAIISSPEHPAKPYSTGDLVPGGAKIKQITPDGVVLEREGELESLSLPKNELMFESIPEPLQH